MCIKGDFNYLEIYEDAWENTYDSYNMLPSPETSSEYLLNNVSIYQSSVCYQRQCFSAQDAIDAAPLSTLTVGLIIGEVSQNIIHFS